jgi:hypothetical protein
MRLTILYATLAALFAAASYALLPHTHESYARLRALHDRAFLANIAVASLTPEATRTEIESALSARDAELAASFLELAQGRGIAVDPQLAAQVRDANALSAQALGAIGSFLGGFVAGEAEDLASLAGTATGDFLVWGDVRDAVREGAHLARGEPADELIFGLSCVGLGVTVATWSSLGAAAPVRAGLSFVKAAKVSGKLSTPVVEWMTRSIRKAVNTGKLGVELSKASIWAPRDAIQIFRDAAEAAVKRGHLDEIFAMMRNVERLRAAGGTRAALDGLKLSKNLEDVATFADLAEKKRGTIRAILKLMDRTGTGIMAEVTQHVAVLIVAAGLFIGFAGATEGTTDRLILRYRRRRKERYAASPAIAGAAAAFA